MRVYLLMMVFLMLAACETLQPAPVALPSETPIPAASATPPATPTPIQRATLPPTWTPQGVVTFTPLPTLIPPANVTQEPPRVEATLPESCNAFGPDLSQTLRTYRPGQDVTVYWIRVPEARFYYVALLDENGRVVLEDYTAETQFVFPADLFQAGKPYGWQVYPINAIGNQMCFTQGAELFPEF